MASASTRFSTTVDVRIGINNLQIRSDDWVEDLHSQRRLQFLSSYVLFWFLLRISLSPGTAECQFRIKSHYCIYIIFLWCCCCCLPTPMTLASGGSPMFPLVVHQPASPSIWPAVQSLGRGMSTNPGVTMWCVCGCSWRDDVCRVCECYRGHSGAGCVLASTLCKYDLRKGDLYVLSKARVRRVRPKSLSSELLVCGLR